MPASAEPGSASPRVAVLGTGALAMLFGARLARAGLRVDLLGTWQAGLRAMAARGIVVRDTADGSEGAWTARVGTVDLSRPAVALPPAALVLVLVKGHQTAAVAPIAARMAARGATVLTLQNGLGHEEVLSVAGRVARGVTSRGAAVLAPGRVRDAGGGETVLPADLTWVGDRLEASGFEVRRSADIRREVWRKLAVSCAINPLSALEAVANGALLTRPDWRRTMADAAAEVAAVARAHGIVLDGDGDGNGTGLDPGADAFRVAALTAGNRSSMLQDLERGAPTEIDALCGAVVAAGDEAGVPVPVNRELWRRVRLREGRPLASEERRESVPVGAGGDVR